MKQCLIDTGPIVALFDASDHFHKAVYGFMKSFVGSLYTAWPVVTEVAYLLEDTGNARMDFLQWLESGGIRLPEIRSSDLSSIRRYMEKYRDTPMDLADASLMHLSDKLDIIHILSLDRDFLIYRRNDKKVLINLLSELQAGKKQK